jgi:recombination protein RecT
MHPVARRQPQTLKSILRDEGYQNRFKELLGARSAQFVSSVLSVGTSLGADCDPNSIIASAMTAATLDLPVDKNLGFAWIVPYKKGDRKLAQFQMGYKGYIQLGLRTGQYERMNARVINAEAFQGWDEVGEPVIDWSQIDESKPSVGYVFAFKLVNGFTKIAFWPKERVEAHAKKYSQSYKGNYDSPWKSNFDSMALKTVVKNELAKWGIMSIEMLKAIKHDQATKQSLEDEPEFPDGTDLSGNGDRSNADVDVVPKISEEQRTALVAWAKEKGVIEKLGDVVKAEGFEMLADITIDKFAVVHDAITRAGEPAPQTATSGAEPKPEETGETEGANDPPKDELLDLRTHVKDKFNAVEKGRQKDLLAGKPTIAKMDREQLLALEAEIDKE